MYQLHIMYSMWHYDGLCTIKG